MLLTKSELKQLDLLKTKKPLYRFSLMSQLINDQFEAMKAGIRFKNPTISTQELRECLFLR